MNGFPKATLPPLGGTHTRFALFGATAFALLFTETGAFNVRVAGTRDPLDMARVLVAASVLIFVGFLLALLLPVRVHRFPVGEFKDATIVLQSLTNQLLMGYVIWFAATCGAMLLYVWSVWPNLNAVHNLVKDSFIYSVVGLIYYQALVAYSRYVAFLYHTRMDNATKVIVAELSVGVLTLVFGLYLLTLDVLSLSRVADPTGLIGLHVTVRDIWVAIIIMVAHAWHIKRIADH